MTSFASAGAEPKLRNVLCVLLGVAALVLKRWFVEPSAGIVHCWGGNVAISFACYFLIAIPAAQLKRGRIAAAAVALAAVEAFEAADGFGIMANAFDPLDFAANAVGVGLALGIDAAWGRIAGRRKGAVES